MAFSYTENHFAIGEKKLFTAVFNRVDQLCQRDKF